MTDPTDRHDTDPLERALRRSLRARAHDAPDAAALTERLLAAGADTVGADGPATPYAHRRGWTSWSTPLVAAACVALIVGIVLAVVRPGHSGSGPAAVASPSLPVPVSSPVRSPAPTPTTAPVTASPAASSVSPLLRGVRVVDLTFTGQDDGWALASADCLTASGRCTALLRTTDGTRWTGVGTTPFDVPGIDGCPPARCVTHIRFADDSTGYAFGPNALYMTVNGALSWTKQAGGADALETLNNNVIRLSTRTQTISVSTSAIGSSSWTVRTLPGGGGGVDSATLVRTREAAYVVGLGDLAAHSPAVLWTSANDGVSWTNHATPCPAGDGVDSATGVAAASNNLVAVICTPWDGGRPTLMIGNPRGSMSVDHPLPGTARTPAFVVAVSGSTFLAGTSELYRTTDRGASWHLRPSVDVSGGVTFAGFESTQVGRLVTDNGRTIWTTRDAGAHWTKVSF